MRLVLERDQVTVEPDGTRVYRMAGCEYELEIEDVSQLGELVVRDADIIGHAPPERRRVDTSDVRDTTRAPKGLVRP